jgi:hypothetical protein
VKPVWDIPEKNVWGVGRHFFLKPITHLITFHYGTITHIIDF